MRNLMTLNVVLFHCGGNPYQGCTFVTVLCNTVSQLTTWTSLHGTPSILQLRLTVDACIRDLKGKMTPWHCGQQGMSQQGDDSPVRASVAKCGYLFKYRPYKFTKTWDLRYFSLKGRVLQYHLSQKEGGSNPRGLVKIEVTTNALVPFSCSKVLPLSQEEGGWQSRGPGQILRYNAHMQKRRSYSCKREDLLT